MRKILIGYDGSGAARRALERAADLAGADGSIAVLSAVARKQTVAGPVHPEPDEAAATQRRLDEARQLLSARGLAADELEPESDDAAEAIIAAAKDLNADLIVVGTGGKTLAQRLMLGSVSTKVVHHAHCDVLVVR